MLRSPTSSHVFNSDGEFGNHYIVLLLALSLLSPKIVGIAQGTTHLNDDAAKTSVSLIVSGPPRSRVPYI
jgi:hypothetical protein